MATMMSYALRKAMVTGMREMRFGPLLVTLIMVISTLYLPAEELDREKTKMGQFGGGGSLEEQCGCLLYTSDAADE